MADRVAVMNAGEIIQESSPRDIYQKPNSRFVASFIGQINFVDSAIVKAPGARQGATGTVDTPWGVLKYSDGGGLEAGTKVTVAIRPENVEIAGAAKSGGGNVLEGALAEVVFLGDSLECRASVGSAEMVLRLHPSSRVKCGDAIRIRAAPADVAILED
jgi:iron(III) transport system ATP-binding protein